MKDIWEARAMEERLCMVAGTLDRIAQYTMGDLEYQAATSDAAANREIEDYFHDWCGRADLGGRHRLRDLCELGIRSMVRDGEHGWVKHIRVHEGAAELRLQAIEADRIGDR